MGERFLVRLFRLGFFVGYLFALAMSTAHLTEWYALSLGGLPKAVALGLAASLEFAAFLLSVASNTFPDRLPTAKISAYLALALVWAGNFLAIVKAAAQMPVWEAFLQSLFVPVSTLAVGKTIGELYRLERELAQRSASKGFPDFLPLEPDAHLPTERFPYEVQEPLTRLPEDMGSVVGFLRGVPSGATGGQLAMYLAMPQERVEEILGRLEQDGLVERRGQFWVARREEERRYA